MKNNRLIGLLMAPVAFVLLAFAAPAMAQTAVWSVTPSTWSALTTATDYTAAQLSVNTVTGTSALGVSNKLTYKTWAAGEDQTGGQYAAQGATAGYVLLANNQSLYPTATADGTVFGGTSGSYTGFAAVTFDVMVYCSDPATLSQTDDSTIFELTVGSSAAFRAQGKVVNHTGVNFPQRKGWKIYGIPTTSVVRVNGFAAASGLEPEFEFNRVYTITLYISCGADTSTGVYAVLADRVMQSRKTAHNVKGGLGAAGNTIAFTSYIDNGWSSGPHLELRLPPRARVDNAANWHTTALTNPAVAANTGTTRVFHTCFTPLATELEGYPLTVTKVTGTPTITATSYGTTSPCPGRSRLVISSFSVGDVVRVSSIDRLGSLEMTADGDQYVGWTSEYIPTGSAVWGIRATNEASAYSIAVNFSGGLVREGSTAGSGNVLFALDPAKVYAIYLTGNVFNTAAVGAQYAPRVIAVNLTDDLPYERLVKHAALTTAWPTGSLGVMSGVYTMGATASEISTMHAGPRPGVMVGDSYMSTYTYQRGTATFAITGGSGGVLAVGQTITDASGATLTLTTATLASNGAAFTSGTTTCALAGTITGTLTSGSPFVGTGAITTTGVGTGGGTSGTGTAGIAVYNNTLNCNRNNIGFHLPYGAESHFLSNGWRPGKPVSSLVPDLVYAASIARSGRSVEQGRSTYDSLAGVQGFGFIAPPFAYNSIGSITVANYNTTLTTWSDEMANLFNTVLNGRNTFIYLGGMTRTPVSGNYALAGAKNFLQRSTAAAVNKISGPSGKNGTMWAYDYFNDGYACFVGATDLIHPSGDTEGPRFIVGRAFGNVGGGFTSGSLVKVAGK